MEERTDDPRERASQTRHLRLAHADVGSRRREAGDVAATRARALVRAARQHLRDGLDVRPPRAGSQLGATPLGYPRMRNGIDPLRIAVPEIPLRADCAWQLVSAAVA